MEQVDVLNPDGTPTGEVVSKKEAHLKGHWHRAVHIWFVNSRREILLRLHSLQVENDPNKWDISAAGHIATREAPIASAMRVTQEAFGLDLLADRFAHVGTVKQCSSRPGYINNEYDEVYVVNSDADLSAFKVQEDEVTEIKYLSFKEFKTMVDLNDPTLVSHPDEYKVLLAYLKA